MPKNNGNDTPRPPDKDDAARAWNQQEIDHKAANIAEGRAHQASQQAKEQAARDARQENLKATAHRYKETAQPGPGQRVIDRLQNSPDRIASLAPPSPQLTAAQEQMKAKREEARQKDREVLQGKREPEKVHSLPTRSTDDRSR